MTEIDDKIKLAMVTGNIAAMKNLVLDIQKTLENAEAELKNTDIDDRAKCLRSVYGGLSGIQTRVDALKSFADASVNIGWVE